MTVNGTESHASESDTFFGEECSFTTSSTSTVTTGSYSNVTSASATLSASYANIVTGNYAPQAVWFAYGTSSSNLNQTAYYSDGISSASGSFSVNVTSLAESTKYYYKAYMTVWNGSQYVDISGSVQYFTTAAVTQPQSSGWLELPATSSGSGLYKGSFGTGKSRNYSYLYDTSKYASLWVAYPLTASHISGSASTTSWNYNPNVNQDYQINVKSSSYQTNYGNGTYSRGHQIPAADRKCDNTMRGQTYYLTNQTPQNQNGFNSPMWSNLEEAVRNLTSSTDTVYVVTGAAFNKVGENRTINTLSATSSSIKPSTVYIPNYYWKALLIVSRSGGSIVSAKTVGVWMEHNTYSSATAWKSYVVSVNQIETWTGFELFPNLPDDLEETAENNNSWDTFTSNSNINSVSGNNWGSF